MERNVEVIDSTMLGDSLSCLRLFYWRYERNLVPVGPQLSLSYGKAVHACLAAHYSGKSAAVSIGEFYRVWNEEVEAYLRGDWFEDPKRNPVRWSDTFEKYIQYYRVEPFTVLNVEAPFLVELDESLWLTGIIDLVAESGGRTFVIDHKTTSYLNSEWMKGFLVKSQVDAYLYAASRVMKRRVDEMLINGILVSAKERQAEKLFARFPVRRNEAQIEDWRKETIYWWSVIRKCRDENMWPRNETRCATWRGCPYHMLCTEVGTDYRDYEPPASLFVKSQWNPVNKLMEAQGNETE